MESIIPERKFANCRLCDTLVSSDNPICKNCGLEMSPQGIIELAEIEESKGDPIYEIREIKKSVFALKESPLIFRNRNVVGAHFPHSHQAIVVEFPMLVAVRAEPLAACVVPFVFKPNSHSIFTKTP